MISFACCSLIVESVFFGSTFFAEMESMNRLKSSFMNCVAARMMSASFIFSAVTLSWAADAKRLTCSIVYFPVTSSKRCPRQTSVSTARIRLSSAGP